MALSAPDLLHMTHQQLNDQFRNAEAGPFPDGIVTFAPDTVMSETAANLAHLIVWKGKVLDSGKGENLQTSKRPDNGELIGPRLHRHPPLPRAWLPRYTAFRRLLHLPGPARFEEITSNKAWVAELREVYGDDINQVDLISGMYAADRPDGFAFSDTAFRIFILMASRRLSSDRFFTDSFTETVYTREGMLWIDQNTMGTVLLRHALALLPYLSGVGSAFAIWEARRHKGYWGKAQMSGLDPRTAARLILAVRFTLGPLCVLFPRFASRWLMFIPPKDNPGTPYFLRLFGGRDTYLGFAALIAEEPTRSQLLGAAAAVDAVDACSALVAGLRGNLPKPAAFFAAAAGTVGSALGLAAGGHLQLAKDRQSAS